MSDDIVARLRSERWDSLTKSAADEIERLRRRLLAEENAYNIERRQNEHLQTDRNNLALEVERLRKGGCARDQRTTQFCADAAQLQELNEGLRWSIRNAERDLTEMREERDEARRWCCLLWPSVCLGHQSAKEYAAVQGWDCFKENRL